MTEAPRMLALVEALAASAGRLRAAMEAADTAAITSGITEFRGAMDAIRGIDAWHADSALKARVEALLPELEASRMLACMLADMTGQRLAAISAADNSLPQPIYRRPI